VYDFYQLACGEGSCRRTSALDCPGVMNRVEFAPLERAAADVTCADVLQRSQSGALFATEPLSPPAPGC
jgi:hypothetical protein